MENSAFKMKGFPQHAGVSPLKDDVKATGKNVSRETLLRGSGLPKPKTKFGKALRNRIGEDAYLKMRIKLKKIGEKMEEFAGSSLGKAAAKGLTEVSLRPRPKKETKGPIQGEQIKIM
jgi:hypothetical protein